MPRRLLEVRLGGKAIREEVIRHALPDYYAQAVEEAALDTIAAPEIDIISGEEEGPLAFDAVVEVRPKVSVAGRDGLRSPCRRQKSVTKTFRFPGRPHARAVRRAVRCGPSGRATATS